MFSQIFFLMLVSFFSTIANSTLHLDKESAWHSMLLGLIIYASVTAALCWLNKILIKKSPGPGWILFFDNLVLVGTLAVLLLHLESFQYIFYMFSYAPQTMTTIFTLLLYFGALYLCNYFVYSRYRGPAIAHRKSINAIRLLAPFTLPLLLVMLFTDLFGNQLPTFGDHLLSTVGMGIVFIVFIVLTMIFLPPIIVWAWGCPPLKDLELIKKLDAICARTHFVHAGYRMWKTADDSITAAIIGVVGKYRYILFTKRLLETIPESSIEAILAHEIGHNKRKHLWIFPFITMGMLVFGALAAEFINFLEISLDVKRDIFWSYMELIAFIAAMALYFRYVFGFFSRQFERQADLYVYEAGVDPNHLIASFQQLAQFSGTSESDPSWHHYSIRERIDFLRKTQENPSLIRRHHRRVYLYLSVYVVILLSALILIGIL